MDIIAFLVQFPFLPEIFSILCAWFVAWRTSRNEVLKGFRGKRIETYDEVIIFFNLLILNPENLFKPEFSLSATLIKLHIKAYGSNDAARAFDSVIEELDRIRQEWFDLKNNLTAKYMPDEPIYDDEEVFLGMQTRAQIEISDFDNLIETEMQKYIPSNEEMEVLIKPVITEIRKSSLKAKN